MLSLYVSPQGHNIFSNLSSTEYSDLMQLLKQSILATDLTLYFEYVLQNTTLLIKAVKSADSVMFTDSSVLTNLQWSIASLPLHAAYWACRRLLGNTAPLWI